MPPDEIQSDKIFSGNVEFTRAGGVVLPAATIDEVSMKAGTVMPHTIIQHRLAIAERSNSTDEVFADVRIFHIAYRPETVLRVMNAYYQAPKTTSGSTDGYTASVDILKSTGGSTGTSILTAAINFSSTDSDLTPKNGVLSGTPTLLAGNMLLEKITVAGSTGTQAQGKITEVITAQDPIN